MRRRRLRPLPRSRFDWEGFAGVLGVIAGLLAVALLVVAYLVGRP